MSFSTADSICKSLEDDLSSFIFDVVLVRIPEEMNRLFNPEINEFVRSCCEYYNIDCSIFGTEGTMINVGEEDTSTDTSILDNTDMLSTLDQLSSEMKAVCFSESDNSIKSLVYTNAKEKLLQYTKEYDSLKHLRHHVLRKTHMVQYILSTFHNTWSSVIGMIPFENRETFDHIIKIMLLKGSVITNTSSSMDTHLEKRTDLQEDIYTGMEIRWEESLERLLNSDKTCFINMCGILHAIKGVYSCIYIESLGSLCNLLPRDHVIVRRVKDLLKSSGYKMIQQNRDYRTNYS